METIKYRPHQLYTIIQTLNWITQSDDPINIIWGHVARSGKSYMMHGIIDALDEYYDSDGSESDDVYLIITTAPNETLRQYIQLMSSLKERGLRIITKKDDFENITSKSVVIASKQLLTHTSNVNLYIRDPRVIMIDEAHFGGSTNLCNEFLKKYPYSTKIFISATYEKILTSFKVKHIAKWDLEDIQLAKTMQYHKIAEKHEEFERALQIYEQRYGSADYQASYDMYPNMNIIGLEIEDIPDISDEWDRKPSSLFRIQMESHELCFIDSIQSVFNYIFMKVVVELDEINERIGQRKILDDINPTTIMCFLPQRSISTISKQVSTIANNSEDFEICLCNTSDSSSDVKTSITRALENAKNNNKRAVLALTGSQGHLGITINSCDLVLLMNNSVSYDFICQTMFRSMSEMKEKKNGYIIDVNVKRAINMIAKYGKQITKEKIEYQPAIIKVLNSRAMSFAFSNDIQFDEPQPTIERITTLTQN